MAWARRSNATLSGTANTGSSWNVGNLGATPSANDRVIAVIGLGELVTGAVPNITGLADSSGLTWNRDFQLRKTYTVYYSVLEVWSAVSTGAAVNSLTISLDFNMSGLGGIAAVAGAYSGLDTSVGAAAAVDISAGADGTNAASPADSGTTGATTAAANELKIGAYIDDGQNKSISAGTLDTTYSKWVQAQSTTEQAMLEDADSGAAGSTARATATYTGTNDWEMAVIVYKLTAVAGDTQEWMNRALAMPRRAESHVGY